jgi:hypothetical protein
MLIKVNLVTLALTVIGLLGGACGLFFCGQFVDRIDSTRLATHCSRWERM